MSKVLHGEILEPEDDPRREERVRGKFWATFRKAAQYIPFAEDLVAAYYCAFDPSTPNRVRLVLIGALAYFVLPFDAVPDFIVGLGFTDDVTILAAAIATVGAHIKPTHREAARQALKEKQA
jgi:uncharacterized membrane protein YkvA (DUF1232 family)